MFWRMLFLLSAVSSTLISPSGNALAGEIPCSIMQDQTLIADLSALKAATTSNNKNLTQAIKKAVFLNIGALCFALGQQDQMLLAEVRLSTFQYQEFEPVQNRIHELREKYRPALARYCARTKDEALGRIPTEKDLKTKLNELEQDIDLTLAEYAKIKCDSTR